MSNHLPTKTITNKYAGTCGNCDRRVEAGAGQCSRVGGRWVVACTTSDCTAAGNAFHAETPAHDDLAAIGAEVEAYLAPHRARLAAAIADGFDEGNAAEEMMVIGEDALYVVLEARGMSFDAYIALARKAAAEVAA